VRRGLLAVVAVLALAASPAPAAKPRVTLITDSVGGALLWDARAASIFSSGFDADLELRSCRRLASAGCPAGGVVPPSALETIRSLGRRIGPNVVVAVGYNDDPSAYAAGIEQVLRALEAAGVEHVFWPTLLAVRRPYAESNAEIVAAARRHREVTVLDWNAHAIGHPGWVGPDGVHLTADGADELARFLHDGVRRVLAAPPPIDVWATFPDAAVTRGFSATLHADGGRAPYRFTIGGLPHGLRATRGGRISGVVPRQSFTLRVHVMDAAGRTATRSVAFRVA